MQGVNAERISMTGSEHPSLIPKGVDPKTLSAMRFVMMVASDN